MDEFKLEKHTSLEFVLFAEFAEFLASLKYCPEGRAEKEDFYSYLKELLGGNIDIKTIKGYFNRQKKYASIPGDRIQFFCDRFIEIFESLNFKEQLKYSALNEAFWIWRTSIYKTRNWPDKYKRVLNEEQEQLTTNKDFLEVRNVLLDFTSIKNLDNPELLWNLLSLRHRALLFEGDFSLFSKVKFVKAKNVHPFNFFRSSESVIACDSYLEIQVYNHITYTLFLRQLEVAKKTHELYNHLTGLIALVDKLIVDFHLMPDDFKDHIYEIIPIKDDYTDYKNWFFDYEGSRCIDIETIFKIFIFDPRDLFKLMPLAEQAYYKTSAHCTFTREYNTWKLDSIHHNYYKTAFPESYPQYFIRVDNEVLTEMFKNIIVSK